MRYQKNLKKLRRFIVIYIVITAIIAVPSLIIAYHVASNIILYFILSFFILLFFYGLVILSSYVGYNKKNSNVSYYETNDKNFILVDKSGTSTITPFDKIMSMGFDYSVPSAGGILGYFMGKYWGLYTLKIADSDEIKIPTTVENIDSLISEIIEKGHLKKNNPTLATSLFGSSLSPQVPEGDYCYWKKDDNMTPETNIAHLNNTDIFSKTNLKDSVIVAIVIIAIMAIALLIARLFLM